VDGADPAAGHGCGGHFGGGRRFCSVKEDAINRLIRALAGLMPTVDLRKFLPEVTPTSSAGLTACIVQINKEFVL
jgi:hypothetical protein